MREASVARQCISKAVVYTLYSTFGGSAKVPDCHTVVCGQQVPHVDVRLAEIGIECERLAVERARCGHLSLPVDTQMHIHIQPVSTVVSQGLNQ